MGGAAESGRGEALGATRAGFVGTTTGLTACMCGPGIVTWLGRVISSVGGVEMVAPAGVSSAIALVTTERTMLAPAARSYFFYFKHRSVRIVCVELRAEEGEDTSEQGKALSETVFGRKQPLEERPLYYMQTWGRASLVRRVVHRDKSMLTIFFVTVHTIAETQSSQGLEAVIDRKGISAEMCG